MDRLNVLELDQHTVGVLDLTKDILAEIISDQSHLKVALVAVVAVANPIVDIIRAERCQLALLIKAHAHRTRECLGCRIGCRMSRAIDRSDRIVDLRQTVFNLIRHDKTSVLF